MSSSAPRLERQARLAPGFVASAEVDDVLHAQRDRHLRRDGRPLADLADEDRPVPELNGLGVGQDPGEHHEARARDVASLVLPTLADVDDLVLAAVDHRLDLIERQVTKRGSCLAHSSSSSSSPASPYAPTFSTLRVSSAHFSRAGEMSMPSPSSTSSFEIRRASSRDIPFSRSVSSEAEAWEMAHPRPWNRTSSITPSAIRKSMPTRSPQSGLYSSCAMSGTSSRPKLR